MVLIILSYAEPESDSNDDDDDDDDDDDMQQDHEPNGRKYFAERKRLQKEAEAEAAKRMVQLYPVEQDMLP